MKTNAFLKQGAPWPQPRFEQRSDTVLDHLTGLIWAQNAGLAEFPLTWQEALNFIAGMNRDRAFGYSDWRLPNRRELSSLMSHQTRKPALPEAHPFLNVFPGWYWTSTTAAVNTAYAWYVHTEGARMFYGGKEQFFLLWPVRGEGYGVLPATGQANCFDARGRMIPCAGTGQDGEFRFGRRWPEPRFEVAGDAVVDRLTGLCWLRAAALLTGHPFTQVREGYWSSTTSMFEPDWAWALYLTKGAVGVGQKWGANFHAWAVCNARK